MAAARKLNKLAATVAKLTGPLPVGYKPWGYTFAFDSMVRARLCVGCWSAPIPGVTLDDQAVSG